MEAECNDGLVPDGGVAGEGDGGSRPALVLISTILLKLVLTEPEWANRPSDVAGARPKKGA